MDQEKQVEVSVVLGNGDFSLHLNGITMNVRVQNANGGAGPAHLVDGSGMATAKDAAVQGPAALPALRESGSPAADLAAEADYYRQVSQEIYAGLGKLAKEINLSIQDLSLAEIMQTGLASPGERLDQVRSQVTDVLEMTEKATLNILNLVEHIQEDCLKVEEQLRLLAGKKPARSESSRPEAREMPDLWSRLQGQGEHLDRLLREHFQESAPSQADLPHFTLPGVLQTLLEFCGAEPVKPHLKAVLGQYANLFRVEEAEEGLRQLALEQPQKDGFYQFPVDQTLESLRAACTDERVQELFSKLLASAPKIFPMGVLPVEGQADGSLPDGQPMPGVLAVWQEFFTACRALAETPPNGLSASIAAQEAEATPEVAQEAMDTMAHIHASLSRITEAMAFQDLSGQRLLKVLKILRQLQVQVLTLLVAAGHKLRGNIEGKEISFSRTEISAQEELDRMLHTLTQASADDSPLEQATAQEGPLDQDAINELLTSMGF